MVDFATVWQAADGRTLAEARRRGLVVPVIIGPQGGATTPYIHSQTQASAEWIVNHNFNRDVSSVRVLSPGGVELTADVTSVSPNQIIVRFASPQTGRVIVL